MPVYSIPKKPKPLDEPKVGRSPWEARVRGFGQGAIESLSSLMGGDDPAGQLMAPVGMVGEGGLGPVAKKAVGGLKDVAESAYGAVQGLKGKFYSRLTDAATRLPERAHPNKITQFLASQSAPEEAEYRGLSTFLKGKGNQMVSREDVLAHLEQNPITLGEKTLGRRRAAGMDEINDLWKRETGRQIESHDLTTPEFDAFHQRHFGLDAPSPTTYSGYQLPGGENYKETLTTLPINSEQESAAGMRRAGYHPDDIEDAFPSGMPEPTYQSPHWDDPNVLVHARTQDRNLPHPTGKWGPEDLIVGRKIADDPGQWIIQKRGQENLGGYSGYGNTPDEALQDALDLMNDGTTFTPPQGPKGRMIENIQSDWHQAGAKSGYGPGTRPSQEALQLLDDAKANRDSAFGKYKDELDRVRDQHGRHLAEDEINIKFDNPQITAAYEAYEDAQRRVAELALDSSMEYSKGIPDAPFKKSWPDLALKQQLLDMAEDPELNWIGVTPGEELVKRGEGGKQMLSAAEKAARTPMAHPSYPRGDQPRFNNEELPNRLRDLLKPFGGKVETGALPGEPIVPDYRSYYNPTAGTHQIYTPLDEPPPGEIGGEHIASVWPKTQIVPEGEPFSLKPVTRDVVDRTSRITSEITRQNTRPGSIPFQLAHLTPEMKAAILKRGFPIMSLLGLMNAAPGNDEK